MKESRTIVWHRGPFRPIRGSKRNSSCTGYECHSRVDTGVVPSQYFIQRMTMSLDAMAKIRSCHPHPANSTSQPANRVSAAESKRDYSLPDQTNVNEKDSSPSEASAALSSESSSNCQYETSSEGQPQKIREHRSTPINAAPAVHNRYRIEKAIESNEKIASEPETVGNKRKSFREIRCESFPVVKNNNQRDDQDVGINRSVSESSQACTNKIKKIVAEVESTGWSESNATLLSESTSKDDTAPCPADDDSVGTISPAPVIHDAFALWNKSRGVKFLPLKEDSETFVAGKSGRKDLRPCSNEKSTSRVRIVDDSGKVIDDLVDIAANPNPSIKSIYFPPSPMESRRVTDLETVARQTRVANLSPRYRSELEALSRIEDELGPLRCKFSELAARVRALSVIGMGYDFRVDPSIIESPGRSTISHEASGYFLHRAQAFCRNDSVKAFPMSLDSKVSTLPTVDKPVLRGNPGAGGSCIWHENNEAELAGSHHRLPNSAVHICQDTPRSLYGTPLQSSSREVRTFHEKPFAYGCPHDLPFGDEHFPEKPDRFHNSMLQHSHSRHHHWNAWKSTLPIETLSNFRRHAAENCSTHRSSNVQHREMTERSSTSHLPDTHRSRNRHKRAESRKKDVDLIGSRISVAPSRDRSSDDPVRRRSSRSSREHSDSRVSINRVSDGRTSINRGSEGRTSMNRVSDGRTLMNRVSDGRTSINRVSSGRRSSTSVKHAEDPQHCKSRRTSVDQVTVERNSKRRTAKESKRTDSRSSDLHKCKHNRAHRKEDRHTSRESFVSIKSSRYKDLCVTPSNDTLLAGPRRDSKTKSVHSPTSSATLKTKPSASIMSYSRESNSSRMRHVVCESALVDSSRDQQIEFADAYSERTIVRLDGTPGPEVADSPGIELCPFGEVTANTVEQVCPSRRLGFGEDSQDSDGPDETNAKQLPDSDEKITIVPVMYTSGIPETSTIREFESVTPRPGKTERSRYPAAMGKTHSGYRRLSTRRSEVPSSGSEASGQLAAQLTRVARVGHERSCLGQWRTTESKLSITYSNTSIRATSVFSGINNEGTVRMDAAVSRLTVSNSPRIHRTRDHSPTASVIATGNILTYNTRKIHSPNPSARRSSKDGARGIGTSPDDFLDDVWTMRTQTRKVWKENDQCEINRTFEENWLRLFDSSVISSTFGGRINLACVTSQTKEKYDMRYRYWVFCARSLSWCCCIVLLRTTWRFVVFNSGELKHWVQ